MGSLHGKVKTSTKTDFRTQHMLSSVTSYTPPIGVLHYTFLLDIHETSVVPDLLLAFQGNVQGYFPSKPGFIHVHEKLPRRPRLHPLAAKKQEKDLQRRRKS
jgi:hypothetical protein